MSKRPTFANSKFDTVSVFKATLPPGGTDFGFDGTFGPFTLDDGQLTTFNNVLVTSHMAFLTKEALSNIADTTFDNIAEYVEGKRGEDLTNQVTAT